MSRAAVSLRRVFPVTLVRRTSWLAAMGSLVVFWKVQYPDQGLVQDWGSLEPSRMMEKRRQGRCQQVRQLEAVGCWAQGVEDGSQALGVLFQPNQAPPENHGCQTPGLPGWPLFQSHSVGLEGQFLHTR